MLKLPVLRPFLVACVGLCGRLALADTPVSGTISTNTTWTLANSPYVVTGDVYVLGGGSPVLTIEAGVTVKFNSGLSLFVGCCGLPGGLQAVGTSATPITFTANTASPTPGYWRAVQLGNQALATSQISYATVSYGGQANNFGGIYVNGSSPTISNVTLQNNADSGIRVNGGSPTITGCTATGNPWGMVIYGVGTPSVSNSTISGNTVGGLYFLSPTAPSLSSVTITNNTGYAMSQDAGTTFGAVSGVTVSGNTNDATEVRASVGSANATWRSFGVPYVVTGDIYVQGSGSPVLTIEAGVTVKFNSGVNFYVGQSNQGGLQAVGTSGSPITFTANSASPTAGYWRGIQLYNYTIAGTQISYATVAYGGYAPSWGGIYVAGCSPSITNVTAQYNANSGMTVSGGAPAISNSTVTNNPWGFGIYGTGNPTISSTTVSGNTAGGIWAQAPASPSLQTVTITNNTGYAMSQDAGMTFGTASGVTVSGNTNDATEVRASVGSANATWHSFGVPYVVTGDIYVQGSGSPVLTIEAGVTVKFNSGVNFYVGQSNPGGLQAVGTSGSPITFTANSASPTAGYWRGIQLYNHTIAGSQIAYATVSYGGVANNWGGISITGCSPTLSNVTVQNNANAGISVFSGSPTISGATISGNPWGVGIAGGNPTISSTTISGNATGGIWMQSPASPTLQTVTITGNTGYAMSQDAGLTFVTVSGLTVSGNTNDASEVRGSVASTNTTWRSFGVPYIATGDIYVQGSGGPVLTIEAGVTVKFNSGVNFLVGQSNAGGLQAVGTSGSPITFTANATSPPAGYWRGIQLLTHTLATTQISYATVAYGGVANNWGGIYVNGCSPTISNVTVQNNAYAGISVSGGSPTVVSSSFIANPAGLVNVTPVFTINARLNYWNSSNGPSGIGPGTGQSVTSGVLFDPWLTGPPAAPEYFSSATTANRRFNPSSTNQASWNVGASQSSSWTFTISNSSSVVVRTATFSGTSLAFTWDGKNDAGVVQPDGTYSYVIQANSGGNPATPATGLAYLDSTLQVAITAPGAAQLLSNVYASGVTDVVVTGSAAMANLVSWTLDYAPGTSPSPTSFTTIASSTQPVINGTLGTWPTLALANGLYTVRLSVSDNQTNVMQAFVAPTVGNFKVSANALQLSVPAGNTVTYTSIVPFSLTETLTVKNNSGQIVRTLVNAAVRGAGSYNDVWDGKNDSAGLLPDGPYFYIAAVTDGTHSLTWDLTNQYWNDYSSNGLTIGSTFDPFNNTPLSINYNFPVSARVSLAFMPYDGPGCNPPGFCLIQNKYTEAGAHTFYWAGVDQTGALSGSTAWIGILATRAQFSKNAIVLFGTGPAVTNVAASPAMYRPSLGNQVVSFNLSTYQSQPAALSVTFLNQASVSVLRTISVASQPSGPGSVVWDGRADNGMLVAPGVYTVTVTATDPLSNVATGQILTTVQY